MTVAAEPSTPPRALADGRYVIGEQLGKGGVAAVYRVTDTRLGVDRAAKVLLAKPEVIRSRFIAEGRALAHIRHPSVVRILDVGETDGHPWHVLELAPGGSLTQRLQRGPLPPLDALKVAFEVLAGLSAIHALGLVHRDVKPGNVLFGPGGEAWISDLGVMTGRERFVVGDWETTGDLGTNGYKSPELRIDPKAVDPRSDLYGVGALLFAAITARPPPDLAVIDLRPEVLSRVPRPVRPVIATACRRRPDDRYDSPRDMAIAVLDAYAALGGTQAEAMLGWFDHHAEHSTRGTPTPAGVPPATDSPRPRPRTEGPHAAQPETEASDPDVAAMPAERTLPTPVLITCAIAVVIGAAGLIARALLG